MEHRVAHTPFKVTMKIPKKTKGPENCPGLCKMGFEDGIQNG
jgi:hypothetical protein